MIIYTDERGNKWGEEKRKKLRVILANLKIAQKLKLCYTFSRKEKVKKLFYGKFKKFY